MGPLAGHMLSICIIQNQPRDSCIFSTDSRNANSLDFQIKIRNLLIKNT